MFTGLNSAEDSPEGPKPEQVRSHFDFFGSRFKGRTEWIDARFPGAAVFADVVFEEDCFFGLARQSLGPDQALKLGCVFEGPTSFRNALFKRTADFARCSFPKTAEDRDGLFENCRFNEVLDLKGVEHLPFSAFQGIRLDQGLSVDPVHPMDDQFEQALEDAQSAAERDEIARTANSYEPLEDPERERRGADNRFAALEAGCRVLKTQMAAAEDKAREQHFFSYEIRAREHRTKHALADRRSEMRDKVRDHPKRIHARWHRLRAWLLPRPNRQFQLWASQRYGRISHYGGSVTAPLATLIKASFWILLVYIGLAVASGWSGSRVLEDICWGMACGDTAHPFVFELVEAVTKGALGPFRLLAGRGEVFGYLGDGAPLFRGVIMAGMLVHGLLASALIFLSLLALRRNFQIN
ncbi:pentapeptide repeat-containing protein [Maricaulis sp. D1M11]|uniref:pentapeptide repeat-containing protein n=1 Tax=Maricaulis sp. D1M11 TaxID=3076117 RepID=UPI0039B46332